MVNVIAVDWATAVKAKQSAYRLAPPKAAPRHA
jgi:hypothetical protein